MSIVPRVVNIPVNRDSRTFERRRRDMLTNLERDYNSLVRDLGDQRGYDITPYRDDWVDMVNRWANLSWSRWDDEMRRLRRGMFSLLPLENFGLRSWHAPPSLFEFENVMNQMEHYVRDLRENMGLMDAPGSGSNTDFLKDAYELDEDGKVHFKVRFDVNGFEPENINVNMTDNCLTVHGKKTVESGTSKSSREFCRVVKLPRSIDGSKLKCNLTEDGILSLEAPVQSTDYPTITFGDNPRLGIRPRSEAEIKTTPNCPSLQVTGDYGPSIIEDPSTGKRLHVEVPVDPVYRPTDLCVKVDSNRLVITGNHQGSNRSSSTSERSSASFMQSYEIPETVDPMSVRAQIIGSTMVIEAPLSQQITIKQ